MWKNPIFQERKKNVKKPYFSGEKKKNVKNPIFQERKKNVKKPYFSGEKKMSKNPSKKKIFTAKFIVKKIRKIFTAKFIVKKSQKKSEKKNF